MQLFALAATLLTAVSAYQVTYPTANLTLTKGTDLNVRWTTVDTDPSTFSIYLVNFQTVHWPPTVISLAQNVQQSAGSATVRIPCSVTSDYGWQINFINGTNTYVIYAQSPMFSLTGQCTDPAPSASVSPAQTVLISNPVVWFVQPSNLVAAAAICPPQAVQTVTVYANAPAATGAAVVCPGSGTSPNAVAAVVAPAGSASAAAGAAGAATNGTNAGAGAATTTAIRATATAVTTGLPRASSNGAGVVGYSAAALVAGAFAMML
ncbi:hypothetical protein PYCC9005_004043 [Savitreella phatthalungensis]